MPVMTQEQLTDHIKQVVLPLLKDGLGADVAQMVKDAVAKEVAPLAKQTTDWFGQMTRGQEQAKPKREIGYGFSRYVRALALNKNDQERAIRTLKEWGDDDIAEVTEQWRTSQESRRKAMAATGTAGTGEHLVPPQFSQDVIELLRPAAILRALGCPTMPMPTGSVNIPKITGGTQAFYQGENTNIAPSAINTGQIVLTFHKLVALIPMSNDLLRFSSPGADTIVRNDVVRALAQRQDQAFIRGDGLSSAPKGLRFWCPAAQLIGANGTVNLANTVNDLGKMLLQLRQANVPMTRCVWIMAPRVETFLMTLTNANGLYIFRDEMLTGRLWGKPYGVSTQVPINLTDSGGVADTEVTMVDLDDCVIGESQSLIVDASMEAAYWDGTTIQASFSQDQTVIRAIQEHDFAVRRDVAVCVMNKCKWGI